MPTISKGMEPKHWEHLLDSLEEERCIVCIGPEVYASEGIRAEEQLAKFLRDKSVETRIRVYDDAWFHYLPDASEIDAWQQVKEFYSQPPPPPVVKKLSILSQLPFIFY